MPYGQRRDAYAVPGFLPAPTMQPPVEPPVAATPYVPAPSNRDFRRGMSQEGRLYAKQGARARNMARQNLNGNGDVSDIQTGGFFTNRNIAQQGAQNLTNLTGGQVGLMWAQGEQLRADARRTRELVPFETARMTAETAGMTSQQGIDQGRFKMDQDIHDAKLPYVGPLAKAESDEAAAMAEQRPKVTAAEAAKTQAEADSTKAFAPWMTDQYGSLVRQNQQQSQQIQRYQSGAGETTEAETSWQMPPTPNAKLDAVTAQKFMQAAGGDRKKAEQMATQAGWTL